MLWESNPKQCHHIHISKALSRSFSSVYIYTVETINVNECLKCLMSNCGVIAVLIWCYCSWRAVLVLNFGHCFKNSKTRQKLGKGGPQAPNLGQIVRGDDRHQILFKC